MKTFLLVVLCLLAPLSCAAQTKPDDVSKQVETRLGHSLNPAKAGAGFSLPAGVTLTDGVTEAEAVAVALWNNPALHAELASLGLARADVMQAGQLTNPQLTLIFPFSFRILEAVANWPLEALWQRPKRVAAAKLELERVSETLVSRALDLVRDVRLAFADYAAARARVALAEELVRERRDIAVIFTARLRAGDISELETSAALADARLAEEQTARFMRETALAQERLRSLLGFDQSSPAIELITPFLPTVPPAQQISAMPASTAASAPSTVNPTNSTDETEALNELIKQALAARPELKAGELAIEAAGARAKWERSRILTVTAIAKEYGRGTNGFEQGPGVLIELPVFHRNQGNISRAEAEIERAARQLIAARQRASADVREAYLQAVQARAAEQEWRTRVLPPLAENIRLAERSFQAGEAAYLFVLETARRYTDERLRAADFQAAIHRALALLERSVGRRLLAKP
jgi:cobalt-zinc-cadmium efflux system outer membrane protein